MSSPILGSFSNTRYKILSMLFEKVRMLLLHCFHHVSSTKKTLEENWCNYFTLTIKKSCLDHRFFLLHETTRVSRCLHILEKRNRKDSLPKNVRKRMFFVKVALKCKAVKKVLGRFSQGVFNTQYYLNNKKKLGWWNWFKKLRGDKRVYRIYITSLDFNLGIKKTSH